MNTFVNPQLEMASRSNDKQGMPTPPVPPTPTSSRVADVIVRGVRDGVGAPWRGTDRKIKSASDRTTPQTPQTPKRSLRHRTGLRGLKVTPELTAIFSVKSLGGLSSQHLRQLDFPGSKLGSIKMKSNFIGCGSTLP